MNYKQQIEEIISREINKEGIEAYRTSAHGIAVFYLELLDSGVKSDHAFEMVLEMIRAQFGPRE